MLKAWWHAQRDFFWNTHPQPTPEDKMPKREASHELDMKRKRQAERGQRQDVSPLSAATSAPLCFAVHVMRLHNPFGVEMAILRTPSPGMVP